MMELLASGRLIDAILVLVALEALLFWVLPRFVSGMPKLANLPLANLSLASLWPNLLAGAFLMLAVRFALTDATVGWVAGALLGALIAHMVDIGRRFYRPQ